MMGGLDLVRPMSALTRFFFRPPALTPPGPWATIAWWESRRPAYNAAVGAAGLVTLTVANVLAILPPAGQPIPLEANLIAPLVFGVAANVYYSAGSVTELLLRRWLGDEIAAVGPAMFRYGFVFSVGLALLPSTFAALDWVVRVVRAVVG
jgi:hypothetical protein